MAVRFTPLYIDSKKVAEVNSVSYKLNSGDARQYGAEGVLGMAEGITDIDLDADLVIPVAGTEIDIIGHLIAKRDVTVGLLVGGKFHQVLMHCVTANVDSKSKSGETTGKFTFQNSGELKII